MPVPLFSLLITCRSSGWRGSCRLCHRSCLGALPSSLAECTVVFMLLFIVHGRCFPKWMIGRPSGDLEYLTIDCLICLYSVLHWIGVVSMKKAALTLSLGASLVATYVRCALLRRLGRKAMRSRMKEMSIQVRISHKRCNGN
uniref:Uncharacterized protein n=1 Tax=Setaria viridis TaxID=4556 RepID=A0A4U6UBU1_SETVI|nr:hypothetical protein SEVIR_5G100750v2 [Setaria viridis]